MEEDDTGATRSNLSEIDVVSLVESEREPTGSDRLGAGLPPRVPRNEAQRPAIP